MSYFDEMINYKYNDNRDKLNFKINTIFKVMIVKSKNQLQN